MSYKGPKGFIAGNARMKSPLRIAGRNSDRVNQSAEASAQQLHKAEEKRARKARRRLQDAVREGVPVRDDLSETIHQGPDQ